jgi:hypothetical protein
MKTFVLRVSGAGNTYVKDGVKDYDYDESDETRDVRGALMFETLWGAKLNVRTHSAEPSLIVEEVEL